MPASTRTRGTAIPPHLRSKALDLWVSMPTVPGPELAKVLRISHSALNTIVRRARVEGDRRAVSRNAGPILGSAHRRVTKASRIRALHARGLSNPDIAALLGCECADVRSSLRHARRVAERLACVGRCKP